MNAPRAVALATLDAADLRRAAAFALRATDRTSSIPILQYLRLTLDPAGGTVRATNLDTEVTVPLEAAEALDAVHDLILSPRALDAAARLGGSLRIHASREGVVTFAGDLGEARARCLCGPDDWPAMRDAGDDAIGFAIGERALHRALTVGAASSSTEETRYYLNGVYLHQVDGAFRAVSTDGHRLTRLDAPGETWAAPAAIMPSRAAALLAGQLRPDGNRSVAVTARADGLVARFALPGGYVQVSKMIDGTYPDYTGIVAPATSEDPGIRVLLTWDQVRVLGTPPRGSSVAVRIAPVDGTMSTDDRDDLAMTVPIQKGTGASFGVNLRYLRELTRASGTVRMTAGRVGDPVVVLDEDPDLIRLVMPMRLPA